MINYRYDGTFPGFLSAVFEVWERGLFPAKIIAPEQMPGLFDEVVEVATTDNRSERVWKGIERIGGRRLCQRFMHVFLSRAPEMEDLLLGFLLRLFDSKRDISGDLTVAEVLEFTRLERTVLREVHRIYMFLRFEQAGDGTWFAPISPKYDVLPLTINHFQSRFSDQAWLIYDTERKYGYFYDKNTVEEVTLDDPVFDEETGNLPKNAQSSDEQEWQLLWRTYFKHIAIKERTNPRLQQQFMPKRFWKHLTEKKTN